MQQIDMLNKETEKQLITMIGQLYWVASQTRPDLSHGVLKSNIKINEPTADF